MELSGSKVIAAERQKVWEALNDPEILQAAIPGCTEMTGSPDTGFEASVTHKIAPVKATFKGAVTLSNIVAGESYTITGEGKGGAAGFASGGADVRLAEHADGTELIYDVKAKVGGKLAQLGSRLIDSVAKKLADQFFTRLQEQIGGPAVAVDDAAEPDEKDGEKKGLWKRLTG